MKARRALAWGMASLALGVVAAAWLQPGMMVELANLLWSCF